MSVWSELLRAAHTHVAESSSALYGAGGVQECLLASCKHVGYKAQGRVGQVHRSAAADDPDNLHDAFELVKGIMHCTDDDFNEPRTPVTNVVISPEIAVTLSSLLAKEEYHQALALIMKQGLPSLHWCLPSEKDPLVATHPERQSSSFEGFVGINIPTPASPTSAQNAVAKLQQWAITELGQLLPDAPLAWVHLQVLQHLLHQHQGSAEAEPPARGRRLWWEVGSGAAATQRHQDLVATLYHLSASSSQAWGTLSRALAHTLAAPLDNPHVRVVAKKWGPKDFAQRLADLQQRHPKLVARLQPVKKGRRPSPEAAQRIALLTEAASSICPVTYLQMVGQKLLHHASTQLPLVLSLPEDPPLPILSALYTRAFAEALRVSLLAICSDPNGDMDPFVPASKKQLAKSRDFKRIYKLDPQTANTTTDADGLTASLPAKSVLSATYNLFKDASEFQAALAALPAAAERPTLLAALQASLQADMEAELMEAREVVEQAFATAVLDAVQGLIEEGTKGGTDAVMVEVNVDSWPSVEVAPCPSLQDDTYYRPRRMSSTSYQILSFLSLIIYRLPSLPAVLQSPLALAALEGLQMMMDHVCGIRGPPGTQPYPAATYLALSAAQCIQRRLRAFRRALSGSPSDPLHYKLLATYASCLSQADELLAALEAHTSQLQMELFNTSVLSSVATQPWGSFRLPVIFPSKAGSGVRLWRLQLASFVNYLTTATSADCSARLLSKVIAEAVESLATTYMGASPSPQRLPAFVAEVVHYTATTYMYTQPLRIPAAAGSPQAVPWPDYIQVLPEAASRCAAACQALCTRLGLLAIPHSQLEAILSKPPKPPIPSLPFPATASPLPLTLPSSTTPTAASTSQHQDAWSWLPEPLRAHLNMLVPDFRSQFDPRQHVDLRDASSSPLQQHWAMATAALAAAAEVEEAVAGLEKRWELHDVVAGLPETDADGESRRAVRQLAAAMLPPPLPPDRLPSAAVPPASAP